MNVEIVSEEKNSIELHVDNLTIVEVLRNYMDSNGVDFVAWRKEHPSKPLVFKASVLEGTVKKSISEGISSIRKDLELVEKSLKK